MVLKLAVNTSVSRYRLVHGCIDIFDDINLIEVAIDPVESRARVRIRVWIKLRVGPRG